MRKQLKKLVLLVAVMFVFATAVNISSVSASSVSDPTPPSNHYDVCLGRVPPGTCLIYIM